MTLVQYEPVTGQVTIRFESEGSYIEEICLSTLYYVENLGLRENLLNITYSPTRITIDS